jgi:AcrR family transcriptional regulator
MSPCTQTEFAPETAVARLSPNQAQAAIALARGATVTRVADSLCVHRSTIYYWFKSDPLFRTAVNELQRERYERLQDEMRELEALAFTAVRQILEDPAAPAGVRFRAAMAVFNRPSNSFGGEAWQLPSMENIGRTLDRRPSLAGPFTFDTNRQIPTSFGDSPDGPRQNSTRGLNFEAPALLPEDATAEDEEEEDQEDEEQDSEDYTPHDESEKRKRMT